jgi:hypothetical protein
MPCNEFPFISVRRFLNASCFYNDYVKCGPRQLSRHSDSLRAGRSGDRIPMDRDTQHLSRPALGPTQPPIQLAPVCFPWAKRPGLSADHPASSCAEVNIITRFLGLFEDELYLLQVRSLHLIKHHAMTTYRRVGAHSTFRCVRDLRNATISFVMSVCASVCPLWTTLHPLDEFL